MPLNLNERLTKDNYWKLRCLAAEEYIKYTPMLPNANQEQTYFEDRWHAIKSVEDLLSPKPNIIKGR